jgi:hypothetical protein
VNKLKLLIGLCLFVAANVIGTWSVLTLMTVHAQSNPSTCDPTQAAQLEAEFLTLVNAEHLGAQGEAVRQALIDVIRACYTGTDGFVPYGEDGTFLASSGGFFELDGEFVPFGTKWGANTSFLPSTPPRTPGGRVTYSFMPNGVDMSLEGGTLGAAISVASLPTFQPCFITDIRAAFSAWEAVANVQFSEVPDSALPFDTPDTLGHIRIGAHIMDGPLGTLAHAYFPPPNSITAAGDAHFDVSENWACTPGSGQIDIGIVALHEIGHSIGLRHEASAVAYAVMNPFYNPALTGLQIDDIDGAQAIYSPADSVAPSSTPAFTPTRLPTQTPTLSTPVTVDQNLIRNGGFDSGHDHWSVFDAITYRVQDGIFAFFRNVGGESAAVLQNTGVSLPPNAPLEASFLLGNSSAVRKRAIVILHDADFSDLQVCSFWLPPNTTPFVHTMHTRTTKAWTSAYFALYAAQADGVGYIELDNVTLYHRPTLSVNETNCQEFQAALPPFPGSDSANYIRNGDFASEGAFWNFFGDISWRIQHGLLEFFRLPGRTSAVVFQNTGRAVEGGAPLEAQVALGNSSAVRKRVIIILHDADFSDLQVCSFWLPPNSAPVPHVVRSYTTETWTDASLSIYASSTDPMGYLQVDDVSLRLRPALALQGTECLLPEAVLTEPLFLERPTLEPTATPAFAEGLALTPTPLPLELSSPDVEGDVRETP